MRRQSSPYATSFSFGPGPTSTALKVLIGANVAMFLATWLRPALVYDLALIPEQIIHQLRVWQLGTYLFIHGSVAHVAINMLVLWMFGTEFERMWGTNRFMKFYFVTGIGAGIFTVLFSLLPFSYAEQIYATATVGASGAIFGLLLAYGMYFPNRPIYLYFVFPIPAKYFVLIIGAISFFSGGGVANITHLGGIVVGYLYLKSARINPFAELRYHYLKWKINRVRRKFDVYSGGRADDWDHKVH